MNKVYLIFLLFFPFFSLAEEKKSLQLPEFFEAPQNSIALNGVSIFYDQMMNKKKLEDIENKIIIVHFWATWNMACLNELIALNNLQREFRKKALLIIAISEDFKGAEAIDDYFSKHKIDYLDIYLDKKHKIYDALNINYLPASYIFDFNGKLIAASKPSAVVDWQNEDLKNYLEEKTSKYQLLPPEYKKTRDKYELSKQDEENNINKESKDTKDSKPKKQKAPLIIN